MILLKKRISTEVHLRQETVAVLTGWYVRVSKGITSSEVGVTHPLCRRRRSSVEIQMGTFFCDVIFKNLYSCLKSLTYISLYKGKGTSQCLQRVPLPGSHPSVVADSITIKSQLSKGCTITPVREMPGGLETRRLLGTCLRPHKLASFSGQGRQEREFSPCLQYLLLHAPTGISSSVKTKNNHEPGVIYCGSATKICKC